MALSPEDRYKVLSNIIARKGIQNINLHAELAKAEAFVNGIDQQMAMQPPVASPQPPTAPIMGQGIEEPIQEEIMPETPLNTA